MLTGITENGEMKNVRVNEEGKLLIKGDSDKNEKTLFCNVLTATTEATTQAINGTKITSVGVANYSENANLSITIGEKTYIIGSNMAIELPINEQVNSISYQSTEELKFQICVKGE